MAGAYPNWYINVSTLTGGTNPVIVIKSCFSRGTFSIARFATVPSFPAQSANSIFSGPSSGAAATPAFRSLVLADLPTMTSAELATKISNETGSGLLVFGTSPVFAAAPTFTDITAGSIFFAGTAGLLSQANGNLFWKNTAPIGLGIGTATPSESLDVSGTVRNLGTASYALTGTAVCTNSNTVTGTDTLFDTELKAGYRITCNAQTKRVRNIASATSLTVDELFTVDASSYVVTALPPIYLGQLSSGVSGLVVDNRGFLKTYGSGNNMTGIELGDNGSGQPQVSFFVSSGGTTGNGNYFFRANSTTSFDFYSSAGGADVLQLSIARTTGAVSFTNIIAKYKNIATVSNGVPSEYATVDLTAQNAAISATTIYAVPSTGVGMYRACYVAKVTTVDGASSVLGGTNGFQIIYTDSTDSVVVTTAASTTSNLNTTQAQVNGCITVYAKASTNIQYSFDYTSGTPGDMLYNLHVKLEAL